MNGRFFTTGPGKGVETEALLGFHVTDVSSASDTLTIDYIDSAGTAQSLDFASGAAGLASATWSTANQTLTLTLVDGTNIPVALSGLETQAEVATAITAAIANRLTRADIIAGNNITISNGFGNSLEISASGGGGGGGSNDGVANLVDLTTSGADLTVRVGRTVGIDLSDTITLPATSNADIDVRIANYARATPSGTIADAQIPAAIARDTELPDTSDLLERSDVVAGTNITLTNGAGNSFTIAAAGGSGGGLTSVSSDSTLQGLGTASDLLGLTDVEVNQLDSVPGLLAETADLSIEVISRTWTDGTDVAAGGFVSHGSGNAITVAEAAALTYFVTRAVTNADGLLNFVVIRVPDAVDLRDVRTRQRIGGGVDLYIDGWHRIGSAGGFTYAYSHNHLYSGYTARFQTSITLATTHFRASRTRRM